MVIQCAGGFFAVDRRIFEKVCKLGRNAAVAYLVLARGTGPDNYSTSWSVNAIENHTGISRGRSKSAIDRLVQEGLVHKGGKPTRPRYQLQKWDVVAATSPDVGKGYEPTLKNDRDLHLVWLPNALVTGANGEVPPLERLRQANDVMIIKLMVDLYHSQNLREDGGISRSVMFQKWRRFEAARYGEFTVWAFSPSGRPSAWSVDLVKAHHDMTIEDKWRPFWQRLRILEHCGVIEWIPCLFESDDDEAEMIHPLRIDRNDGVEGRLRKAAVEAGLAMLTEHQALRALNTHAAKLIVPVKSHFANAEVVSVARLRYRPHTKRTGAWWAHWEKASGHHISEYEALLDWVSVGQDSVSAASA